MRGLCFRLAAVGLVLIVAACAAKPVRDVIPIAAQPLPASAPVAAPAPRSGTIGAVAAEAPAQRIDEFYPASGGALDGSAAGGPRRRAAAGDITLDFVDADLRDVVRAILGDILNQNFVIDPDVNGRVTLSTNHPIAAADLLPTLEAVLASQGVGLLAYDTLYRITRSTAPAALAGGGIEMDPAAGGRNAGYRVFPLNFIAADHMKSILEPLLPEGAVVYADARRNVLILAGNTNELRLATSTVGIFDVDQMVGQNVHLISLQKADAKAVTAELEGIFITNAQTADAAGLVQFIPIARLNAIMVISKQQSYIEQARKWIFRLDRSRDATKPRIYVYYVQHGKAKNLAESLQGIIGFGGDGGVTRAVSADDDTGAVASGAINPAASDILSRELRISVDDDHNALLISATIT